MMNRLSALGFRLLAIAESKAQSPKPKAQAPKLKAQRLEIVLVFRRVRVFPVVLGRVVARLRRDAQRTNHLIGGLRRVEIFANGVILGSLPGASPFAGGPSQQSSAPYGYTPIQIQTAYGLSTGGGYNTGISFAGIKGDGTGQTIGIFEQGYNPAFVPTSDPDFSTSARAFSGSRTPSAGLSLRAE